MGRPKKEEDLGPEACCHPAAPLLPHASLCHSSPPQTFTAAAAAVTSTAFTAAADTSAALAQADENWKSKDPKALAHEIATFMGGEWPTRPVRKVQLASDGVPTVPR